MLGRATASHGIRGIVLIGLDVGLYELGGDQLDRVAERLEAACEEVRSAAGFHADQARREVAEVGEKLAALQLLTQHRVTVRVDSVHLEDVLCKVNPDGCNVHGGRSCGEVTA